MGGLSKGEGLGLGMSGEGWVRQARKIHLEIW